MKIRIIEMLNHFPDNSSGSAAENSLLGRFCAFGYHDAIDVHVEENEQTYWEALEQTAIGRLNGSFNMKTLVCAFKEQGTGEKEREFWKETESPVQPFYFISVIRVDKNYASGDTIHNDIKAQNENVDKMVYYSFEHSEVITVCRTNCYSQGLKTIRDFNNIFHAIKSHSVFAVEEKVLKLTADALEEKVMDDIINVRLYATMRDREKAIEFLEQLRKKLKQTGTLSRFEAFDTLGNDDLLVEIDGVQLSQILPYYKMGSDLTHSHILYKEAFYNIETKFIVKGGILSAGVDNEQN